MQATRGVKLILREHVDHLGDRGAIVSVKPGFARNFLIPKGLAYEATAGNLKVVEHQKRTWALRDAKETAQAEALRAGLEKVVLKVKKRAGDTGTLYGSVTKAEVVELLSAQGFDIDRRAIGPDEAIKAVGEYPITVKIHRGIKAELKLTVEAVNPPKVVNEPVEKPDDDNSDDDYDQ